MEWRVFFTFSPPPLFPFALLKTTLVLFFFSFLPQQHQQQHCSSRRCKLRASGCVEHRGTRAFASIQKPHRKKGKKDTSKEKRCSKQPLNVNCFSVRVSVKLNSCSGDITALNVPYSSHLTVDNNWLQQQQPSPYLGPSPMPSQPSDPSSCTLYYCYTVSRQRGMTAAAAATKERTR